MTPVFSFYSVSAAQIGLHLLSVPVETQEVLILLCTHSGPSFWIQRGARTMEIRVVTYGHAHLFAV